MQNTQNITTAKIKLLPRLIYAFCNFKLRLAALLGGSIVGARALIIQDQKVLLIRHTYDNLGWLTVGGGVNRLETAEQAICREVMEEVGLKVESKPKLFGVYHSHFQKRDNYIVFYLVENVSPIKYSPSPEIAEMQWFEIHSLPENVSPATRRRVDEILGLTPISDKW